MPKFKWRRVESHYIGNKINYYKDDSIPAESLEIIKRHENEEYTISYNNPSKELVARLQAKGGLVEFFTNHSGQVYTLRLDVNFADKNKILEFLSILNADHSMDEVLGSLNDDLGMSEDILKDIYQTLYGGLLPDAHQPFPEPSSVFVTTEQLARVADKITEAECNNFFKISETLCNYFSRKLAHDPYLKNDPLSFSREDLLKTTIRLLKNISQKNLYYKEANEQLLEILNGLSVASEEERLQLLEDKLRAKLNLLNSNAAALFCDFCELPHSVIKSITGNPDVLIPIAKHIRALNNKILELEPNNSSSELLVLEPLDVGTTFLDQDYLFDLKPSADQEITEQQVSLSLFTEEYENIQESVTLASEKYAIQKQNEGYFLPIFNLANVYYDDAISDSPKVSLQMALDLYYKILPCSPYFEEANRKILDILFMIAPASEMLARQLLEEKIKAAINCRDYVLAGQLFHEFCGYKDLKPLIMILPENGHTLIALGNIIFQLKSKIVTLTTTASSAATAATAATVVPSSLTMWHKSDDAGKAFTTLSDSLSKISPRGKGGGK